MSKLIDLVQELLNILQIRFLIYFLRKMFNGISYNKADI